MTSASDFARHAKHDEFGHQRRAQSCKYKWMGGYIVTNVAFPVVVGRVIGQDGYARYQIAARPCDEISVGPFDDREAAFEACVAELERRAK